MKSVVCILLTVFLTGCRGGCQHPSQRHIYNVARHAVEADASLPDSAKILPIEEAKIGIAKNAAQVDVAYEYDADSGALTYEIDTTSNEINLTIDGVLIEAASAVGTLDLSAYVTAINAAASISTVRQPSSFLAAILLGVSRNGASVVHVMPTQ